MSWRQILLGLILADFLALTGVVLFQHGYLGFFELAFANTASTLLFTDLVIVLGLASVWMWQDARERGVRVVPYLAVGAFFGAAGPLLYLIVRERQTRQAVVPQRA
jgi:hypothetical protein